MVEWSLGLEFYRAHVQSGSFLIGPEEQVQDAGCQQEGHGGPEGEGAGGEQQAQLVYDQGHSVG